MANKVPSCIVQRIISQVWKRLHDEADDAVDNK